MGDISHSYRFPAEFPKHVSAVIEERLKTYLKQSGHIPQVKVIVDKATWQHQTRQPIGVVTFVPDSDQPLQAYLEEGASMVSTSILE